MYDKPQNERAVGRKVKFRRDPITKNRWAFAWEDRKDPNKPLNPEMEAFLDSMFEEYLQIKQEIVQRFEEFVNHIAMTVHQYISSNNAEKIHKKLKRLREQTSAGFTEIEVQTIEKIKKNNLMIYYPIESNEILYCPVCKWGMKLYHAIEIESVSLIDFNDPTMHKDYRQVWFCMNCQRFCQWQPTSPPVLYPLPKKIKSKKKKKQIKE